MTDKINSAEDVSRRKSPLFPSFRLLLAFVLFLCFLALSISSGNIAVALICMTEAPVSNSHDDDQLIWKQEEIGLVFAAQNAGSLMMLLSGAVADQINAKLMVGLSMVLGAAANLAIPLLAPSAFWFAAVARLLVGFSDACLQPSVNSLITRWFPTSERAVIIGFVTGGRQIAIGGVVFFLWLPIGADKPSKQPCISFKERMYIEERVSNEWLGKRTDRSPIPWNSLLSSGPLWAGIFALVCHEYPLVILLQFLPSYFRDVLRFEPARNGVVSAMPIGCLFIGKTVGSGLASLLTARRKGHMGRTTVVKLFNGVGSFGLAISVAVVPLFGCESALWSVTALCSAMLFAGFHTPGVQTALVQMAPPFTGVITGISFFLVAVFGIGNKLVTQTIVRTGATHEWQLVFQLSAIVASLPLVVFTLWGSAERQQWAAPSSQSSSCNGICFVQVNGLTTS